MNSGHLTLGQYTRDFESQFADLVGVQHAIAVNSGTSALEIVLRANYLKPRDEVIVPTNTFVATAAAVVFAGGKPVITDISHALTLDPKTLKQAITKRTRGVIAVHIGGLICPEIKEIKEICEERGLFLVEDAAHAHGSMIDGKHAGSIGIAGCFSFYPTKVVTSGEGGMISTNSESLANIARTLRDQGKESFSSNRIVMLGYNWRMPELCAAMGIVQIHRLSEFIQKRNAIAKIYDVEFNAIGLERVLTPPNQINSYYKYTFFLPRKVNRDRFKMLCRQLGVVYGGEVYWPPLHLQPAFRKLIHKNRKFYMADDLCRRMVNPPMFSQMNLDQAQRVVEVTRKIVRELTG